jgi:hypothetical protein
LKKTKGEIAMTDKLIKTALCLVLFISLFACSELSSAPTPSAAEIEKEEQIVYSFFINPVDGPALILENTYTSMSHDDTEQTIDYIQSDLDDISKETLNNFLNRNQESTALSSTMELDAPYLLLTSEELKEIASQPNWGKILTDKYPGSYGYSIFSRVGFNNSLDQALIYVGFVGGPLMGSGSYYLMEKQGGEWVIKDQIEVWMS